MAKDPVCGMEVDEKKAAAALLKERGYEVIGVIMKIWPGKFFSRENSS